MDCSAAFPSIDRNVLEQIVRERCPAIADAMAFWFSVSHKQVYRWHAKVEEFEIKTGVGQGDPLAGALFAIGLADAVDRLQRNHPELGKVAFLDETYLMVTPAQLVALLGEVAAVRSTRELLEVHGGRAWP